MVRKIFQWFLQYCPSRLELFQGQAHKVIKITLAYRGKKRNVVENSVGRAFGLGNGWGDFIKDNTFVIGQRLKFQYVKEPEMGFQVSMV